MEININFRRISDSYQDLNEKVWDIVIGKRKWCNSIAEGLREVGRPNK